MSQFLRDHPTVKQAAFVARTFRIDPITVLNSSLLEWNIRKAAAEYIGEQEAKAAKKK